MQRLAAGRPLPFAALVSGLAALALAGCTTLLPPPSPRPGSPPLAVPPNATAPLTLNGAQEVPPVTTSALATGAFEVRPDGSISGSIATTGIDATAAHIHIGMPGANGPVIVPLTRTADNVWSVPPNAKITGEQYDAYLVGGLYVNVHSGSHPSGEIRAQLNPK